MAGTRSNFGGLMGNRRANVANRRIIETAWRAHSLRANAARPAVVR
jgi:hypothetical protein